MSTIREDMAALMRAIAEQKPSRPPVTIHHPKCKVWTTHDLGKCNCGGWAFPA